MGYWLLKMVLTPILRILYRFDVEGREHVPRSGAVILAANHRSFLDSIFLPLVVPRRVTFVAKAEYFESSKTAWFFRAMGQIPIQRGGGAASERALASAMEVLDAGRVFGIYPEGTRTRDGDLHRGRTGVARLSLRAGAPIIPVGLVGIDEVMPTDARLPRILRRVTIRFGEPIDTRRHAGGEDDRMVLRAITDEVMYEIQHLSGYRYVDTYASRSDDDVPNEVRAVSRPAEPGLVAARIAS